MERTVIQTACLWVSSALLALALSACSDGSGKANVNNPPPPPADGDNDQIIYTGPAPSTSDVQNFKTQLWDRLAMANRCGGCHGTDGQSPRFVRADDINLAYTSANSVVNLDEPSASLLVTKVANGHNCWVQSVSFCEERLIEWISSWADDSGVERTVAALSAPALLEVGASLSFPDETGPFAEHVYPLLTLYCADCHRGDAPQAPVQPYFASSNVGAAYLAAQSKMLVNFIDGRRDASRARLVQRLREEAHNCWGGSCSASANQMQAAIEAFAQAMEVRELDERLITSKALRIADGTAISQGGRVETNAIALYTFKEGMGTQANDAHKGFEPDLTLNLYGDVEWVSNWGVRINNGRLQGSVSASAKLRRYITQTGEYSVEAWVVPANVSQDGPARIVSYSGSNTSRNFTLGQTLYNYDFMNRSQVTNANGTPMVSTPNAAEVLQATLQHVVASYDSVNGRRIYVNGQLATTADPAGGGGLGDWDNTFALVVGNETSGEYPWRGTVRFLAIHNRALTAEQAQTNYEVGVGQKIMLPFFVGDLIDGMEDAYIVFQVEQFDDYSYLFSRPFLFSFTETPANGFTIEGLRIGVNGREAPIGQSFANLRVVVDAHDERVTEDTGVPLSTLGAVIMAEQGPELDQFFLSFDRIDAISRVRDPLPTPEEPEPADLPPQPRIGVRTFAEINASLSAMTGIPVTDPGVAPTYEIVKQQMPPSGNVQSFLVAHQMGITQLAVKYCNVLANDNTRMESRFPGFNGNTFNSAGRDALINPLLRALLAHHIASEGRQLDDQPFELDSHERLNDLIDTMTAGCPLQVCDSTTSRNTVTAVCAAALGSALMLVK